MSAPKFLGTYDGGLKTFGRALHLDAGNGTDSDESGPKFKTQASTIISHQPYDTVSNHWYI